MFISLYCSLLYRYLMGVASLGGLSPCDSNNNNTDCSTSNNNNNNSTVDLESAQEHFQRALSMMDRLREEAVEQEGPDAQVSYELCAMCYLRYTTCSLGWLLLVYTSFA